MLLFVLREIDSMYTYERVSYAAIPHNTYSPAPQLGEPITTVVQVHK